MVCHARSPRASRGMSCHGMSWYVMVCHARPPRASRGMAWYVMVCHGMSWYVMLGRLEQVAVWHGMPWYVMVRHGMPPRASRVQCTPSITKMHVTFALMLHSRLPSPAACWRDIALCCVAVCIAPVSCPAPVSFRRDCSRVTRGTGSRRAIAPRACRVHCNMM